jgi:putative redox protein
MLKAKAEWVKGLEFDAWDGEGRAIKLDASVQGGGEGAGFRPAELPLIGLAGCTGIDTIEILKKMREQVTGLSITVTSNKRAGQPAGYDGIHVDYEVRGRGLSQEKVERAIELSQDKYCTVGQALSKATTITRTITIIED